jgi:hypothetical protein
MGNTTYSWATAAWATCKATHTLGGRQSAVLIVPMSLLLRFRSVPLSFVPPSLPSSPPPSPPPPPSPSPSPSPSHSHSHSPSHSHSHSHSHPPSPFPSLAASPSPSPSSVPLPLPLTLTLPLTLDFFPPSPSSRPLLRIVSLYPLQSHTRILNAHARTCTQPRAVGVNGKGRPPHLQLQNIPHFPRSISAGVCSHAPPPPLISSSASSTMPLCPATAWTSCPCPSDVVFVCVCTCVCVDKCVRVLMCPWVSFMCLWLFKSGAVSVRDHFCFFQRIFPGCVFHARPAVTVGGGVVGAG